MHDGRSFSAKKLSFSNLKKNPNSLLIFSFWNLDFFLLEMSNELHQISFDYINDRTYDILNSDRNYYKTNNS